MSDTGRPFGPFELFEVIADSPLGAVHRARRVADGKSAEVFRLDGRLAGDADYLKRFLRQSQAAAKLPHPNLVTVMGCGEACGQHYLATETTDGGTVGDLLQSAGPLPEAKAVGIVRDCARALQAGWDAAQLTHGGINVETIRLQRDGVTKLAGLALARPDESSRLGDTRALGDVLLQMLLNELPLLPNQPMPDLHQKRPAIGPFVGDVIEKMRAQPAWSYTGYAQLIEDLDAVLAGHQPAHTQVKLSLGSTSARATTETLAGTTPAHVKPRQGMTSKWKAALIRLAGLLVLAAVAWQTWQYFNRARLLPLPPAPVTPPAPITLVPAEPALPPAPAAPTFESVADQTERGRAAAKQLGAARLQPAFGGKLSVLDDGQVMWSYAFRSDKELDDFSEGTHRLQNGALLLPRAQTALKWPLTGDITVLVEGRLVEADAGAPMLALAVAWHQGADCERGFGFTRTAAELWETAGGKRVVLASAPFEPKPGTPVRYLVTQRGKAGVVKVRDGPMLIGTFSQPAEGALRLISDGCVSGCNLLEITATAHASRLSQIAP
jgi:serine/threonine-protein kinase